MDEKSNIDMVLIRIKTNHLWCHREATKVAWQSHYSLFANANC